MMEVAPLAPVRAKSFPLQERTIWERLEEEQLCQQTRAMQLFEKAQEKEKVADEQKKEEAHQHLISGLERGKELLKELCEQAEAHEEENKSVGKQIEVRIIQNVPFCFGYIDNKSVRMSNHGWLERQAALFVLIIYGQIAWCLYFLPKTFCKGKMASLLYFITKTFCLKFCLFLLIKVGQIQLDHPIPCPPPAGPFFI